MNSASAHNRRGEGMDEPEETVENRIIDISVIDPFAGWR